MSAKPGLALSLIPFFLLSVTLTAQTPPPAVECIPQDAVICLQLSRPAALIELLAGERVTRAITSLPFYRQQASNPKFNEFLNVVEYIETALETDWRTGLTQLTAGGITLAVCPEETLVAVIDAADEGILVRLHDLLLDFARAEAQKQGHPERVASKEYAGVTAWTFGGKEAHAIIGKRLIFASRAEGLKAALDLFTQPDGKSLAAKAAFRAAKRTAGPDAVATVFVNLRPLMSLPGVAQLLEQQAKNPLAALVFAGITESFRRSNWLASDLDVTGETLTLRVRTDGKTAGPESAAAFALPQKAADGSWPNISVPRRIAAMSLYRDLYRFYAAKDTLFPERTSGLIFFENMMGIFFTGRDLTSEVLGETEPSIRIVVAEQQYDPAIGTPQVEFPAFAVILRLRHPEQFGKVVEEAWQKAVGLINFTRGQQALPGLIIDRPIHEGTKYTVAYFSTADVEDKTKLDTRFNARPALAMLGQHLILSSTDGLARDLIDALERESDREVKPISQTHSALEIDGTSVATALEANRETLVRSDMVNKGKTQEDAEAGIDMLITFVRLIDRVKLRLGAGEGPTEMQLQMKLNLPE